MVALNALLKAWLPPAVKDACKSWVRPGIHFKGKYGDWETALASTEGYEASQILERVRWATRQVVEGKAIAERDSVLLTQIPYPFPVLAVLLRAALENNSRLSVLDFGGALGTSYRQCQNFLGGLGSLHWSVVEQPHFVRAGKSELRKGALHFYETVGEAIQDSPPQVVLCSGVLQYLSDYDTVLGSFVKTEAHYIIIDRTPIAMDGNQVISTQSVPDSISAASYPLWLFNEEQMKKPLLSHYDEIAKFPAVDGVLGYGALKAEFKGFVFKRKTDNEGFLWA